MDKEYHDFKKDCPNYDFLPTILPAQKRVIVIGDIHGDLQLAIKSFKLAKLINDNFKWIANPLNTIVVQVGDQIDSCRPIPGQNECHNNKYGDDNGEDMGVLTFFNEMHIEASKYGGAVYSLLGNHELMNADGNFDYVSYNNYHNFSTTIDSKIYNGPSARHELFKKGGKICSMLACKRQAVLIVGNSIFVHAGILPALMDKIQNAEIDTKDKLKYLNSYVRKWLLNKVATNNYDIINNEKISPFWTRIFGQIPSNTPANSSKCSTYVKGTLKLLQIGHMIVGHTPQLFTNGTGINGTCYESDGTMRLFRVDGGFADAFKIFSKNNHMVQVLEIIDDSKFKILLDNSSLNITKKLDISDTNIKKYTQNRQKTWFAY